MIFRPDSATYEIQEFVAEGATATVYKAARVDSRGHSRQQVALKVLKDKTAVQYLRQEFESMSQVQSEYCARVLSWENDGENAALALEWIEGVTLHDLLRQFRFEERHIKEVVAQVGMGLKDLNEFGRHHGDLHLRNVMIDIEGRAKLIDFGAICRGGGTVRGVVQYLAPEQWRGETSSFATDLFALGLIEKDLRLGVAALNSNLDRADVARARAESAAESGSPLLKRDPSDRDTALRSEEDLLARSELGAAVKRLLESRLAPMQTQAIELNKNQTAGPSQGVRFGRGWGQTVAALALTLISALSAPVRAEAPLISLAAPSAVDVRSQHWLEIELNGRRVGYAPISIGDLKPGPHRLYWRGPRGSGEFRFDLRAGSHIHLTEADLLRSSHGVMTH